MDSLQRYNPRAVLTETNGGRVAEVGKWPTSQGLQSLAIVAELRAEPTLKSAGNSAIWAAQNPARPLLSARACGALIFKRGGAAAAGLRDFGVSAASVHARSGSRSSN
jgi:hypothetical protein